MADSTPRGESFDSPRVTPSVPIDPLEPTLPESSLGEAALSGSLWTLVQVVVVKIVTLSGTLVLMHLLTPDVFGVASLALSLQAVLTVLQPFTMGDVLLSRSGDLTRLSGTAYRLSLFTTILFAIVITVSGPWAARSYHAPTLALACGWVALRPIAEWMVVLPLTRLRARLQFKTISTMDALGLTGSMLVSVAMAWKGLGVVSVILPSIAFIAFRAWLYRRAAPAPPSPAWLPAEVPSLMRGFSLAGLGQYVHSGLIMVTPLIVGAFAGKHEVGWYSMAFAMSAQINTVVSFSMGVVLQPIFVQMANDLARQSSAFLRACRVLATLAMPVCLLQAVLAPAAFRTFLPDQWEGAIVLTQILSVGQAFFFSVNPAIGLLNAQGRFGTYMGWQTVQLIVVVVGMLGAGVFWRAAPLVPIVLVGGLYPAVSAPVGVWLGVRGRGQSFWSCLTVFLRPLGLAIVGVLPAAWAVSRLAGGWAGRDVLSMVLVPIVSIAVFVSLVRRLDRETAEDYQRMIQGILRRIRPRKPG